MVRRHPFAAQCCESIGGRDDRRSAAKSRLGSISILHGRSAEDNSTPFVDSDRTGERQYGAAAWRCGGAAARTRPMRDRTPIDRFLNQRRAQWTAAASATIAAITAVTAREREEHGRRRQNHWTPTNASGKVIAVCRKDRPASESMANCALVYETPRSL